MNSVMQNLPNSATSQAAMPQMAPGNMPIDPSMIQKFQEFKKTFTGDPKAQVMAMLQQGKIGNGQLQQVMQMANQMKGLFK